MGESFLVVWRVLVLLQTCQIRKYDANKLFFSPVLRMDYCFTTLSLSFLPLYPSLSFSLFLYFFLFYPFVSFSLTFPVFLSFFCLFCPSLFFSFFLSFLLSYFLISSLFFSIWTSNLYNKKREVINLAILDSYFLLQYTMINAFINYYEASKRLQKDSKLRNFRGTVFPSFSQTSWNQIILLI